MRDRRTRREVLLKLWKDLERGKRVVHLTTGYLPQPLILWQFLHDPSTCGALWMASPLMRQLETEQSRQLLSYFGQLEDHWTDLAVSSQGLRNAAALEGLLLLPHKDDPQGILQLISSACAREVDLRRRLLDILPFTAANDREEVERFAALWGVSTCTDRLEDSMQQLRECVKAELAV
eukprot:GHVS01055083.1.p1 GENE.GHVS01055083.1~~GHVS01055083.1.p1  ORF type:complete len:178 (-),score=33.31 GHVS01055083.1:290-823(-)